MCNAGIYAKFRRKSINFHLCCNELGYEGFIILLWWCYRQSLGNLLLLEHRKPVNLSDIMWFTCFLWKIRLILDCKGSLKKTETRQWYCLSWSMCVNILLEAVCEVLTLCYIRNQFHIECFDRWQYIMPTWKVWW